MQLKRQNKKQQQTIADAAQKQIKALETLKTDQQLTSISDSFSKDFLTAEAKYE